MNNLRKMIKTIWIAVPEKCQKTIVSSIYNASWFPKNNKIADALSERVGYKEMRQYAGYLSEHFEEEVKRIKEKPVFLKVNLDYHVGFFHAGIIIQTIEYTIVAMKNSMIPVFFINDHIKSEKQLCLDWFFEQPYLTVFGMDDLDLNKIEYVNLAIKNIPYRIEADYLWNMECADWCVYKTLANKIISKNAFFAEYLIRDKEKNSIAPQDCLGVLIRGTDYVKLKPKYHPAQPEIDEIINKVREIIKTGKYKGIYVATDEKRIFEKVCNEFGKSIVFSNSREYYDEIYRKEKLEQICEAKLDRNNDQYFSSLEYISSMFVLSECKGIVGGTCSGSVLAALFSNSDYQYFFNKGLY